MRPELVCSRCGAPTLHSFHIELFVTTLIYLHFTFIAHFGEQQQLCCVQAGVCLLLIAIMNIRVCRLSPALLAGNGSAEQIFNINPQCRVTAKEIAEFSVELQTKVREDFTLTRAFS